MAVVVVCGVMGIVDGVVVVVEVVVVVLVVVALPVVVQEYQCLRFRCRYRLFPVFDRDLGVREE